MNASKCIFSIIILVISIVFVIIACDNGNNTQLEIYTVTFNADNGTENTIQNVTKGKKAIKPDNPTKKDHAFVYWFIENTENEWNFSTVITANITLKAKWIIQSKTYTVTFISEDESEIITQNVEEGKNAIRPLNPERKNGYAFYHWFCEAAGNEWEKYDFRTIITENTVLKAKWVKLVDDTRSINEGHKGKWEISSATIDEIYYETSPFGNLNTIGLEFGEYYLILHENSVLIDQFDYLYTTDFEGNSLLFYNLSWGGGIAPFGLIKTVGVESITVYFTGYDFNSSILSVNCKKVSRFSWE